jgi:hypothetical protein
MPAFPQSQKQPHYLHENFYHYLLCINTFRVFVYILALGCPIRRDAGLGPCCPLLEFPNTLTWLFVASCKGSVVVLRPSSLAINPPVANIVKNSCIERAILFLRKPKNRAAGLLLGIGLTFLHCPSLPAKES